MKTTNALSWLAIVISILALILALVGLNQPAREKLAETSSDLELQIESLQQQVEINQSRQRLEDIRQRLASGNADLTEAQKDIAKIRSDLKGRFQNAEEVSKQFWQQLDERLNQVEINLREGGVNVLETIDKALDVLKTKIKYG